MGPVYTAPARMIASSTWMSVINIMMFVGILPVGGRPLAP
jgi:hypothetical protein